MSQVPYGPVLSHLDPLEAYSELALVVRSRDQGTWTRLRTGLPYPGTSPGRQVPQLRLWATQPSPRRESGCGGSGVVAPAGP